jgi:hypothetical protein
MDKFPQTSLGAKHPLKLVVEGLRPSDQNSAMLNIFLLPIIYMFFLNSIFSNIFHEGERIKCFGDSGIAGEFSS